MRESRVSEAQPCGIRKEQQAGTGAKILCRWRGPSVGTPTLRYDISSRIQVHRAYVLCADHEPLAEPARFKRVQLAPEFRADPDVTQWRLAINHVVRMGLFQARCPVYLRPDQRKLVPRGRAEITADDRPDMQPDAQSQLHVPYRYVGDVFSGLFSRSGGSGAHLPRILARVRENPEGHETISDEFVDMASAIENWFGLRIEETLNDIGNAFRWGFQNVFAEVYDIGKPDDRSLDQVIGLMVAS